MAITLNGTSGISTPGLTNTGTGTLVGLTTTGNTILGDASTDTLNVGNGDLVKDASGNVGIGTSSPAAKLDVAATIRSTANVTPTSGSGLEIIGGSTQNYIVAYNRTTPAFLPLELQSSLFTVATAGSERMRIDSSGNVGIGSVPNTNLTPKLEIASTFSAATNILPYNGLLVGSTDAQAGDKGGVISLGGVYNASNEVTRFAAIAGLKENSTSGQYGGYMAFYTRAHGSSPAERMRIDASGVAMFNTSSTLIRSGETFRVSGGTGIASFKTNGSGIPVIALQNTNAVSTYMMAFTNSTQECGTITTGSNTVGYNSNSDYRLKKDVKPMTGALDRVAALKPVTYKWKSDSSNGEGFIAHELAEVCPHAVTGEKDAVNAEGKPVYQGIDTSFLVATLTAAIQELKAIIDTQNDTINNLTTRLETLEGAV